MPIVSGPPWALSEDDMLALLADFHCWLTNPWAEDRREMASLDAAAAFLHEGRTQPIFTRHGAEQTWCDLCGFKIPAGVRRHQEPFTGDNQILCDTCFDYQSDLVRNVGLKAYRALHRKDQQREAGNG